MGIRYDKTNRKATNGPMFFFSIMQDELFAEEIRSAFISGLSFYAYRFPGDTMLTYGSSEGYVEGLGEPGFVIGRFLPDMPLITIPYKGLSVEKSKKQGLENLTESKFEFPLASTSYESYSHEVSEIIKALKEGRGEKVVAARAIVKDYGFDLSEKFYELCHNFPDSFVFCFGTKATGCWIGATPELLLKGKEGMVKSMALAGTRPVNTPEPWDSKNIEEQKIVTDYIENIFRKNGYDPQKSDSFTKPSGGIEHICTEIVGSYNKNNKGSQDGLSNLGDISNKINEVLNPKPVDNGLSSLLRELSPTPALCGSPKEFAIKMIKDMEDFDRGCYGGFCGPYRGDKDFTFHVILRCAAVSEQLICIYAGGGITSKSNVKSEWEETSLKAQNTLL